MALVKPDCGNPHVCEGAIVNEWFVVTHANCCPSNNVRVSLVAGKSRPVSIYHSFIHEQLCLLQFAEPVTFVDFKLQPVCVNANCPEIGSPALYVQQYRSIETHFYRHIVSDGFCEYHIPFKFYEHYETCTLRTEDKCQPIRPEIPGHPLASFKDGFFLLRGVYTREHPIFPPAPFDAAGYTATCKDNSWFHHVGFCGYTKYNPPLSWDIKPKALGLSNIAPLPQAHQLPFFVAIFSTFPHLIHSGVIVGPRHVITVDIGRLSAAEVAYSLDNTINPVSNFADLPNKIVVSTSTYLTGSVFQPFVLLTLESDFPFFNSDGSLNEQVQPICLPTDCGFGSVPQSGEILSLAGIGPTALGTDTFLRKADLLVDMYDYMMPPSNIPFFHGEARVSYNDVGGPVFRQIGGKYFLISIMSDWYMRGKSYFHLYLLNLLQRFPPLQ